MTAGLVTQDDFERAQKKAYRLLETVLPESAWTEFMEKGVIGLTGKRGHYVISPYSQTEISDLETRQRKAFACLQLSIPTPTYDRIVAEYLLLKNAEDLYWETANIFSGLKFIDIVKAFLIIFNAILFLSLFF